MADGEKIRILIVDDIADTRENLAKLIGFEPDMTVAGTAGGGQEAVTLAKKERPNVILMDINMPDMDGITATEIISNTVPESPIIMMSVQGEQDYLRRSMLAGAREFLVKPFSADELINAIRHVHELEKVRRARYAPLAPAAGTQVAGAAAAPAVETGKIISFFSPKGGVGRTTIATNLAVALHQSTEKPVVLVDGSLPFGDIAVILNMSPKAKTIADLIGSFEQTDADVVESILVQHSTGIKVLLAPPTPESTELITGAHIKHVLEILRQRYAYVIVDTWPSYGEQVITMLDAADVVLSLMTLEITSLKNIRVFMEVVEKLGYSQDKVQLVANRNDSSGGIKASDVEASLGRKIPHTIVSDGRTLVLAVNRGVPFVISHKDSQVSKDIFSLAAKLAGAPVASEAGAAAGKQAARPGGLKLFGAR
ncbi:MAG: response regulator [Chloroflexi bacterium]|nr:MAG: response regulator [Chloroflexota bacterium]TMB96624.1 MAG: response regulator [Chloroflexota bacterium]TMC30966.1 MAG: response regulator [Chloroflexota bacterium]TMC32048.1 MAG: response regulator [Chloroflexota bacterium]TMC56356.1 MAG: response regulator [Chloroflexota bacterium]